MPGLLIGRAAEEGTALAIDLSAVTIHATAPTASPATLLAEMGVDVLPILQDEGAWTLRAG